MPRLPPASAFAILLILLAGCALLAYATWTTPLREADQALAAGQHQAALQGYATAEARFSRLGQYVLTDQRANAAYNQLALLYRAGDYDGVIAKSASAPSAAAPHFWSGSALLAKALAEKSSEARVVLLGRAEEELKQALQASPDEWDAKFNYEIAARLGAGLRREPKKKSDTPMQLLRPQPIQPRTTRRTG